MAKLVLLMSMMTILMVMLAYIMYSPLPDGFPIQTRIGIGIHNIVDYTSIVAGYLGWNRAIVLRDMLSYLAKDTPRLVDHDMDSKPMVFDGIPVHVLAPKDTSKEKRAIVYYHGGGWAAGDLNMYYHILYRIAKDLNAVVIYVEYRMAPEHVFPAAVDDCEKATRYFFKHATDYGVDPNRIALMGDSAGGNLAASVTYRFKQSRDKYFPKLQVLIYPMIESLQFDSPSYRANGNGPVVTKDMLIYYPLNYLYGYDASKYYTSLYSNSHTSAEAKNIHSKSILNTDKLPNDKFKIGYKDEVSHGDDQLWTFFKTKLTDPSFCPLCVKDAGGFPKTYISTCQYDVLRDEGFYYAEFLRSFGVEVEHNNVKLCYHSWFGAFNDLEIFDQEFIKILKYINTEL